tara:strand:+ start:17019 stop:17267 length:249 start_codon:yes stop_codon:yes gene_type:complete
MNAENKNKKELSKGLPIYKDVPYNNDNNDKELFYQLHDIKLSDLSRPKLTRSKRILDLSVSNSDVLKKDQNYDIMNNFLNSK